MENGKINRLSKQYQDNPYGINLDTVRLVQNAHSEKKPVQVQQHHKPSKKRSLKLGTIGVLSALGLAAGASLFSYKLTRTNTRTEFATNIAQESNLKDFDLQESLADFSALLQSTDYLLHKQNLTDSEMVKLKENLLTIEHNLSNVLDYSDSQIESLFSRSTGHDVEVQRGYRANTIDGAIHSISINISDYAPKELITGDTIYEDKNYSIDSNDLFFSELKSDSLKKLITDTLYLASVENHNDDFSKEKTFNVVKDVVQSSKNLDELSIHIDDDGKIIEDEKELEK